MSRYMIIALSLLAPLNIRATPIQGGDPRGDDRPLNLGHPEYEHEWRAYEADQIRYAARMEQIQNAMEEIQSPDIQPAVAIDDIQVPDVNDIQAPDTTIIDTPFEPIQPVSDAPNEDEAGPLQPLHAGIALPAAAFSLVGSLGTVIPESATNIRLISDTRGPVMERRFDVNQKSSYVAITTATLTTSYTKALWVRAYDTLGYPHLMGSASGNAAATGPAAHYLYLWGGRLIGGNAVAGKRYQILDSSAIPVNQWVHVALTYDDATKRLTMYRNGVQVATAVTPVGWTLGAPTTVGNQDGIYGLNGCIDRAYVYNQALSATQIAQLYTDEKNPATPQTVEQPPPVPVTQAPVPVTQKPTVPVTQKPTVPVTQKPTVPVTQAPVPVTQKPTVPVTQAPVPATQAPVPVTQAPVPVTQAPVPVTQAPVPPTTTTTSYPAGAVIGTAAQKINYRGGSVMVGATKVYILFYGGWASSDPIFTLVPSFVNGLSGSGWWNIQTSYPQTIGGVTSRPSNQISWGGYSTERGTEAGSYTTIISDSSIYAMINKHISTGRLPWDPQGLYLVLTAPDVQIQSGFCTSYCGWHTSATASRVYASTGRVRYGLVGSGIRCPSSCLPNINPSVTPNGDRNADGMMSILAHELAEMVSDPDLSAWLDSSNYENADKCAWNYGKSIGALYRAPNGAYANLKVGGRDWLIQSNWVNFQSGYCGMKY